MRRLALAALLALTLLLAAPASAQQPQTQSTALEEGEGEQTTETQSFAEELATLGVNQDPNDPITRVDAAFYMGVFHRRIRDYSSLYAMVKSYSKSCYDDIGFLSPNNDYQAARTICYLKNKGVFTNTYSQGINPASGFDRDIAAIYHARSGRYLGPLPSAGGAWNTYADLPGCEIFVDVSCSNPANHHISELFRNSITSGCGDPSDNKFCPGIRFTRGHANSWADRMISDLD